LDTGEFNLQTEQSIGAVNFALWSFLHEMAMLELAHLKGFDADFDKYHRLNLETMIHGFLAVD